MSSKILARRLWERARFALLLAPALLAGCYVVPIVPRPVYGPGYHRAPPPPGYYGPRGHWRYGEAQPAPAVVPSVHIEVASSSR